MGVMEMIRIYWGGMLDLGVIIFWEDFNVEWLNDVGRIDEFLVEGKVDVYFIYGDYCYVGLCYSYCYGWVLGFIVWLFINVLGIKILVFGCEKIVIEFNLGDLEWVEGIYFMLKGIIKVRYEKFNNGDIKFDV